MVEFQSSEPKKSRVKIKVKIGENEIDIEGTISDVQESLELVPEIINKLSEKDLKQEKISNKEESNPIEEKAQDTIKINPIVAIGCKTVMPPNRTPTKRINIPLTVPRTVPPIIYAKEISKLESGACKISGS